MQPAGFAHVHIWIPWLLVDRDRKLRNFMNQKKRAVHATSQTKIDLLEEDRKDCLLLVDGLCCSERTSWNFKQLKLKDFNILSKISIVFSIQHLYTA